MIKSSSIFFYKTDTRTHSCPRQVFKQSIHSLYRPKNDKTIKGDRHLSKAYDIRGRSRTARVRVNKDEQDGLANPNDLFLSSSSSFVDLQQGSKEQTHSKFLPGAVDRRTLVGGKLMKNGEEKTEEGISISAFGMEGDEDEEAASRLKKLESEATSDVLKERKEGLGLKELKKRGGKEFGNPVPVDVSESGGGHPAWMLEAGKRGGRRHDLPGSGHISDGINVDHAPNNVIEDTTKNIIKPLGPGRWGENEMNAGEIGAGSQDDDQNQEPVELDAHVPLAHPDRLEWDRSLPSFRRFSTEFLPPIICSVSVQPVTSSRRPSMTTRCHHHQSRRICDFRKIHLPRTTAQDLGEHEIQFFLALLRELYGRD